MAKTHIILMADIIASSKRPQAKLMGDFKHVVGDMKKALRAQFLSPPTITLGDEFQSVPRDLGAAIDAMLTLEEAIVRGGFGFKLRYVVVEGRIETPINAKIAHGMLGPGLTAARERLEAAKKPGTHRFQFALKNGPRSTALGNAFVALQHILDGWRVEKDYPMVTLFLEHTDYKKVAEKIQKDRSQVYKRGRSLGIEGYLALKSVIRYLGGSV